MANKSIRQIIIDDGGSKSAAKPGASAAVSGGGALTSRGKKDITPVAADDNGGVISGTDTRPALTPAKTETPASGEPEPSPTPAAAVKSTETMTAPASASGGTEAVSAAGTVQETRAEEQSAPSGTGTLTGARDQSGYLNELYEARQKAALEALEAEYQKSTAALDREAETIPSYYNEAARQAAGLAAREKQAMNERFAASGLNTGTAGQAAIAQSNVMQSEQNAIRQAEARALADIEADRASLAAEYQAAIRQAILDNETEKAQALYEEAVRVDNSLVSTALKQAALDADAADRQLSEQKARAQTMAAIGDYSGYAGLGYSEEQIAALEAAYRAANEPASTGSSAGSSGDGDLTMDYEGLFRAAQASGYPAAFLAQKANYQKYGFSSSSGLAAAYESWLAAGGGSGGDAEYRMLTYSQLSDQAKNIADLIDSDLSSDAQYERAAELIGELSDESEQNYLLRMLEKNYGLN